MHWRGEWVQHIFIKSSYVDINSFSIHPLSCPLTSLTDLVWGGGGQRGTPWKMGIHPIMCIVFYAFKKGCAPSPAKKCLPFPFFFACLHRGWSVRWHYPLPHSENGDNFFFGGEKDKKMCWSFPPPPPPPVTFTRLAQRLPPPPPSGKKKNPGSGPEHFRVDWFETATRRMCAGILKIIHRPVPTDSNSRAYLGRDSDRDPNKRDYFYFYVWGQKSRDY